MNKITLQKFVCVFLILLSSSAMVKGQSFIDRWTFKTNLLEWCITIPNFSFEYALSSAEHNRSSIGLTAKYNWNSYHRHAPVAVFDMFDIRPEYRYYFRTFGHKENEKLRNVKYLGAYADYGQYSFKLKKGIQGSSVGVGISFGWVLPVYQFKKGALDIDLGFSAGIQTGYYDMYARDLENNCYYKISERSKKWHVSPFPVVSELRVAIAWHTQSVKDKYIKEDPALKQYELAASDVDMAFDNIYDSFEDSLEEEDKKLYAENPSAYSTLFSSHVKATADDTVEYIKSYNLKSTAFSKIKRKIKKLEKLTIKEFEQKSNKKD